MQEAPATANRGAGDAASGLWSTTPLMLFTHEARDPPSYMYPHKFSKEERLFNEQRKNEVRELKRFGVGVCHRHAWQGLGRSACSCKFGSCADCDEGIVTHSPEYQRGCPFFSRMQAYDFSTDVYEHCTQSYHRPVGPCRYANECRALKRLLSGDLTRDELVNEQHRADILHFLTYSHPNLAHVDATPLPTDFDIPLSLGTSCPVVAAMLSFQLEKTLRAAFSAHVVPVVNQVDDEDEWASDYDEYSVLNLSAIGCSTIPHATTKPYVDLVVATAGVKWHADDAAGWRDTTDVLPVVLEKLGFHTIEHDSNLYFLRLLDVPTAKGMFLYVNTHVERATDFEKQGRIRCTARSFFKKLQSDPALVASYSHLKQDILASGQAPGTFTGYKQAKTPFIHENNGENDWLKHGARCPGGNLCYYYLNADSGGDLACLDHLSATVHPIVWCPFGATCEMFQEAQVTDALPSQFLCHLAKYSHPARKERSPGTREFVALSVDEAAALIDTPEAVEGDKEAKQQRDRTRAMGATCIAALLPDHHAIFTDKLHRRISKSHFRSKRFPWENDGPLEEEVRANGFGWVLQSGTVSLIQIAANLLHHPRHLELGAPLSLDEILAVLCYTGTNAYSNLRQCNLRLDFKTWPRFQMHLRSAILKLIEATPENLRPQKTFHGMDAEFNHLLQRGAEVRALSIEDAKEVLGVHGGESDAHVFVIPTFVSTTWNPLVAKRFAGGAQLMFHCANEGDGQDGDDQGPTVVYGADVSWISKFPTECEILFPDFTVFNYEGVCVMDSRYSGSAHEARVYKRKHRVDVVCHVSFMV